MNFNIWELADPAPLLPCNPDLPPNGPAACTPHYPTNLAHVRVTVREEGGQKERQGREGGEAQRGREAEARREEA